VEMCDKQKNDDEEIVKKAIRHCVEHNILKDFLLENEEEVVNIMIAEYNEEMEKQVIREESWEDGRKEGTETGEAKAIIDLTLEMGYSNEKVISTLQRKLEITEEQAEEYLKKFQEGTLYLTREQIVYKFFPKETFSPEQQQLISMQKW